MPHGASVAQDGKTLLCYGMPWASNDVLGFNLSMNALYVMSSEDGGYTWDFMSSIGLPADNPGPGYCTEPYVIQLQDGTYLAAYRNQDGADMTVYISRSENGKKWTTPTEIEGILGGPPHLLELDNGAILLTYGYRVSPKCGIRGALSYDSGLTWDEEFVISESERRTSTDLGYPASIQLPDGSIVTGYYDIKKGDVVCSFLYTKWRLEESAK